MQQVNDFEFKVRGAGGDDICSGHKIAREAWGERAEDENGALLAMAYLWRRFGPPWRGGDDHKSLVDYTLTTNDPQVFLWLRLCGAGLAYSVGYLAHESLSEESDKPMVDWLRRYEKWWWSTHLEFLAWQDTEENKKKVDELFWAEKMDKAVQARAREAIGEPPSRPEPETWRADDGIVHRVNQAIFDALKELERPVYVRDCAINIFGRCDDTDSPAGTSKYAGYGVPKEAMDKHFVSQEEQ